MRGSTSLPHRHVHLCQRLFGCHKGGGLLVTKNKNKIKTHERRLPSTKKTMCIFQSQIHTYKNPFTTNSNTDNTTIQHKHIFMHLSTHTLNQKYPSIISYLPSYWPTNQPTNQPTNLPILQPPITTHQSTYPLTFLSTFFFLFFPLSSLHIST